jgi:hypothetical protein
MWYKSKREGEKGTYRRHRGRRGRNKLIGGVNGEEE